MGRQRHTCVGESYNTGHVSVDDVTAELLGDRQLGLHQLTGVDHAREVWKLSQKSLTIISRLVGIGCSHGEYLAAQLGHFLQPLFDCFAIFLHR